MKKILIVSHALELGGAEKALLGLLETIDTTEYQVDLFLMRHQGELLKYIPNGMRLLSENQYCASLAVPLSQILKKGQIKMCWGRIRGKRKALKRIKELKLGKNDVQLEYSHKYTVKYLPQISNEEYDLAISFLTPHYFVANKVKAKKKVAWIHTDYSAVSVDKESQRAMWAGYDSIASISDTAAKNFVAVFPEFQDKVIVIENILPVKYINSISDKVNVSSEMPEDGTIKLLSIGRFCVAKNFDSIPAICKLLVESGLNVKWYIIGFGADEALIKQRIKENSMEDRVIILGKKENPYPYIKACDLYVQPSRFEGRCVSVTEAQLMAKPVVITDYPTSASQLENGVDGIIVPLDNEKCAEGIAELINNPDLMTKLSENCKKRDYSNKGEIIKINRIMKEL